MHTLTKLTYSYDALEPHMDKTTMEIHHSKHHQAYVDKLNAALLKHPALAEMPVADLLSDWKKIPSEILTAVRNNGGGVANHDFFFSILKKGTTPKGKILEAINSKWGSFENFQKEFNDAALGQFGSGWAWLVKDAHGNLEIMATPNQDTPLSSGKIPLLCIDVWEHAYYLKHQNRRPEYVKEFWNVVDWEKVEENYS